MKILSLMIKTVRASMVILLGFATMLIIFDSISSQLKPVISNSINSQPKPNSEPYLKNDMIRKGKKDPRYFTVGIFAGYIDSSEDSFQRNGFIAMTVKDEREYSYHYYHFCDGTIIFYKKKPIKNKPYVINIRNRIHFFAKPSLDEVFEWTKGIVLFDQVASILEKDNNSFIHLEKKCHKQFIRIDKNKRLQEKFSKYIKNEALKNQNEYEKNVEDCALCLEKKNVMKVCFDFEEINNYSCNKPDKRLIYFEEMKIPLIISDSIYFLIHDYQNHTCPIKVDIPPCNRSGAKTKSFFGCGLDFFRNHLETFFIILFASFLLKNIFLNRKNHRTQ